MNTKTIVLIVVALAVVAGAIFFIKSSRSSVPAYINPQPVSQASQQGTLDNLLGTALSFGLNEAKKKWA